MNKRFRFFSILLLALVLVTACSRDVDRPSVTSSAEGPQIDFAIQAINTALAAATPAVDEGAPLTPSITLGLAGSAAGLELEGFSISVADDGIEVVAVDVAGLMYGGLELAEQIRLYGADGVADTTQNPYMAMRGTKFNIPLDVRTPSYTHASDAAQKNMPHMWDIEFWKAYIDVMARHRYNFISLWSLHPFPSMVKVPDYPDVALDDVRRSTIEWNEYYSLGARDQDDPAIYGQYEVLKNLTIEEKIAFWQEVMRYGKSRNVDFYVVTWNIFVNGTEGKYGLTIEHDNAVTRDYFRKSVLEMFRTYPDLAGVGLTTGENMQELTMQQKEDWAYDTYALGVLDAAREMPERQFKLIHRQHQADMDYIREKFAPVLEQDNVEFIYSFKYAKAHVFSSIVQPYHEEFVNNLGGQRTIWTLRNDDAYYFRWGSPEFVREFIRNIPHEVSEGMYYGSDQWIWGRDFTSKDPVEPNQLEVEKHWYHWMMWGRLAYDPTLSNERFIGLLADRFQGVDAGQLYRAWHAASMVYPITTGFHWGRVDFLWYIEGCRSRPENARNETGFHDVEAFIFYPVHPSSGNQTIPDFVEMTANGGASYLRTPLEVSQELHATADSALALLEGMDAGGNAELAATLHDIRTVAHMGKYYAYKIAGSTHVALYRAMGDQADKDVAIAQLTGALAAWERYTALALKANHNPVWLNRVGNMDWQKTTEWVKQDIELARAARLGND